jgi:hypothetical protein
LPALALLPNVRPAADENMTLQQQTSVIAQPPLLRPRTVKKVPFVELFGGHVQGVISSGSDENRVYVAFVEAGTSDFNCTTNNNRPCGGLYSAPCKHIGQMVEEAVLQFGAERVAQFLKLQGDPSRFKEAEDIMKAVKGSHKKEQAGAVFSRFLNYLRYCELKCEPDPVPEMSWFV